MSDTCLDLTEYLDADAHNAVQSRLALTHMFPESETLIGATRALIRKISDVWGRRAGYEKAQADMDAWAKSVGIRGDTALELLGSARIIGGDGADPFGKAQDGLRVQLSCIARNLLWGRFERDFFSGLAELLRGHASQSVGVRRMQAETAGTILWIAQDATRAKLWWDATTSDKGARFHRKYSGQINSCMRELGVYNAFQLGSGMSQHSRPNSVGLGMIAGARGANGRQDRGFSFHEIWDPEHLLVWFALFVRLHRQVLSRANQLLPEISQDDWVGVAAAPFWTLESRLWEKLTALRKSRGGPFDFKS